MKEKDISNAELGDHFTFIFKNEKQLFSVILPFLMKGLENNEKCIYVFHDVSKERIISKLIEQKRDINEFLKSGQLTILSSRETYLKGGFFDPDRAIAMLKEIERKALDEGYGGVRITGEASWINSGNKGTERLMEYESKLRNFFPGSRTCAICQYDERAIDPGILAESIHCHPEVIFYNKRCENLYYSPNLFAPSGSSVFPVGSYELIKEDFLETVNK
ncbi:MAG: hypothetical protein HGA85_05210 [Nanoarchaeota archaeon]|nr:hypothetical protein [Nanoarchaeota archaeon]